MHHRLLQHRRAQRLGERGGLGEGVRRDDLVAGQDHRLFGPSSRLASCSRAASTGALAVSTRVLFTEIERRLVVQDVAGQRDEHRAGRRRGRDLGGAAQDARQVLDAVDLDRPFHHRRAIGISGA